MVLPADTELVTLDRITTAVARVAPVLRATPTERSDSLSRIVGRSVLLKPEHLQRAGSFKIRGAYNFMFDVPERGHVVAGSAGNHAQGVALAATLTGRSATIFMPQRAPLPKLAATREYGAEVELVDGPVDDCIAAAAEFAARTGATLVPPFDHPAVIAGQGTIGVEILDEAPEVETILVPVGGGGLVAGVAAAVRGLRPGVRVVGVQAAGAASMERSLASGGRVEVAPMTMADGVALKAPGELTLAHCAALVDEVLVVSEEEISRAVIVLLERAKAVVEPSGALGVAALLAGKVPGAGPAVAILSGGNVDPILLRKLIAHGLSAAGRYAAFRVVIDDRPGALHDLTGVLARLGVNVLSVEHHREGLALPLAKVSVQVTLETRDRAHQEEITGALTGEGYRVTAVH